MKDRMEMFNMHLTELLQGKNKYGEEAIFKEIFRKISGTLGRHVAGSSSCSSVSVFLASKSNGPQSEVPEQAASASPENLLKMQILGFPGGAVVENPPANAGDTGSIPGPGRSHNPP